MPNPASIAEMIEMTLGKFGRIDVLVKAKAHGIPREQVIREVLLAQQPNKRFTTVEELGAFTLFLTSDAAASITGTSIAVDGGWTAH